MAEACAVAKASGAEVDAAQVQAIFDGLPSGIRSSMQKDLASSRRLELDAIAARLRAVANVTASTSPYGGPDCCDSRESY